MARHTVTVLALFALVPAVARAQAAGPDSASVSADSVVARWRPHFAVPPLTLRYPLAYRAPWLAARRMPPGLAAMAWDSALAATLDSSRAARERDARYLALYGPAAPPSEFEEAPPPGQGNGLLGLNRKYADLTIDGEARLDIRTDRLRNKRCNGAQVFDPNSGCRGGFKAPRIENQFNLRAGGLIGQRLHLDVDLDTQRDFAANQNIRVYYQGLEDEVVRRIEVGSVSFRPPPSRFITSAIPASNFGVNATFEVGPWQVQALAATQKGIVVAQRTYAIGQTTSQPQDRVLRDADFDSGRFFWVADPALLPGYPAVDILKLDPAQVAVGERPVQVRVYRFRAANNRSGATQNLGGINAVAVRHDGGPQRYGTDRTYWDLLVQGTDYYLDPSGLWIALNAKLDQNDYLAVSYTTAAGTRIGTFPSTDTPGVTDTLELVVAPKSAPTDATFRYEMRQLYRVAGTDLDRSSLIVNLLLNRSERPQSGSSTTYLGALNIAVPTDANVFDQDNRLFPRSRDPGAEQVIRESYVVFPSLQPFADPARLTPAERTDSLYRTPTYLVQSPEGPPAKFQLRLRYNSTGAGDRTTLNLNALQVREGTEKLTAGSRALERGVDYQIAYETGVVTFLNPDQLFGAGGGTVQAQFEERGVFAVAPTSIFGLTTRYALGDAGSINLIGLYQRESSAYNRPQLGFEASANLIGGINTDLHFRPRAITRFFDAITNGSTGAESRIDLNGELAFTKPDPNRSGVAYLEEFEGDASVQVSLRENVWEFGSAPQRTDGVSDLFPTAFDSASAVQLTWQNLVPRPDNTVFEVRPQDIDPGILLAGGQASTAQLETPLFLTLHADTAGGFVGNNNHSHWTLPARTSPGPRWRSMVTALSTTGLDFTRNEYLEFWVYEPGNRSADSAGVRLVLDLGSVNEDALALAPDSFRVNGADTTYSGRRYTGVGRLDTERRPTGIFNADVDDIGILNDRPDSLIDGADGTIFTDVTLCHRQLATSVPLFPWGDLSGRCTSGNGTLDTEDLNGDQALNATGPNEQVFRYVVDLRDSKNFVRDGGVDATTGARWRLFRVPIRTPDAVIGSPNLRLIQQLRMTVVAPANPGRPDMIGRFGLARMRFVGAPWARRADRPIAGLFGATAEPSGEVLTSIVSTENKVDLGYTSPPGVTDALARRDQTQGALASQINEKSLRVLATGLAVGQRAEAYLRFPSGPQNLLNYRELRVWMRGRGAGWDEGDFQAYVKLGSDNQNFYLFRAPAKSTTWEPEFVIDLEIWRQLRADIESRWLAGQRPSGSAQCPGTDSLAYVACTGNYVVQVRDPGVNPPNLAAAQEVDAGIFRVGQTTPATDAELWVDDIRLTAPVSQMGKALAFDTRITASDVADISISFARRDGQFRQIGENPSYRTNNALQLNSTWRLDRFLPRGLGLAIPVSVSYARTRVDPQLLTGTDLRGDALAGLRKPDAWSATYSASIRRQVRGSTWLSRGLLDPFSLSGTLTRGHTVSELSDARGNNYSINASYLLQLGRHGFTLPLGGIVKALPRWLRESDGAKGVTGSVVSLTPSSIRLSSGLTRDEQLLTSYTVPVFREADGALAPTHALQHLWRNSAGLTWQPLGMLTLNGDLTSTRDLRIYGDSSSLGRLAYLSRQFLLGLPVGVERDRNLTTSITLAPRVSSWLRPRYVRSTSFILSRSLNSRDPVRSLGDTISAFILPQTLNNARTRELGASVDLARGLRQLVGDSSSVGRLLRRFRPTDIANRVTLTSTYDLAAFDPDLGFMLGKGGLDQFLSHNGERAKGVSETRTTSVGTGADLPFGLSATVTYALTRALRFQGLGNGLARIVTRQVEWPIGSLRWSLPFAKGPLSLVGLGAQLRMREGQSVQEYPSGAAVTLTRSSTLSPDLQITLRNGLTLSGSYSALRQTNQANGNVTRLVQNDMQGSMNYSFALPKMLSRQRRLARSSLTALSTVATGCLLRPGEGECTTTSDARRRELRGGLDTDIARSVTAGLQLGYTVNDARHLDTHTSQLFLMATFQLSLFAGDYR